MSPYAVVSDSAETPTFYIATGEQGIFRFSDEGAHWASDMKNLTGADVSTVWTSQNDSGCYNNIDIKRNPCNAEQVMLASFQICSGYGLEIGRSSDGGETWELVKHHNMEVDPIRLGYHPLKSGTTILAVSSTPYFYESSDNGGSWIPTLTNGLPSTGFLTDFVVDPNQRGTLYASFSSGLESGVYVSYNAGVNWALLGGNIPAIVQSIAVSDYNLYVGTAGLGVFKLTKARLCGLTIF